ncbi:MAG: isoprenylcysteine carboxylmethyltransferase family protein [Acidobacteriota bacterium]|nr:MAG: isoprenylcysteine carboxylmethyltransferase family protein [Acidobacteriota bacterium]
MPAVLYVYVGAAAVAIGSFCLACRLLWRSTGGKGLSKPSAAAIWSLFVVHVVIMAAAAFSGLWPLPFPATLSILVGSALFVAGVVIYGAAAFEMGSLARISGQQRDALIQSGVYRVCRHPQYVGWGLALIGAAVAGRSGFALLLTALYFGVLPFIVRSEERQLEARFGATYVEYRGRTAMGRTTYRSRDRELSQPARRGSQLPQGSHSPHGS